MAWPPAARSTCLRLRQETEAKPTTPPPAPKVAGGQGGAQRPSPPQEGAVPGGGLLPGPLPSDLGGRHAQRSHMTWQVGRAVGTPWHTAATHPLRKVLLILGTLPSKYIKFNHLMSMLNIYFNFPSNLSPIPTNTIQFRVVLCLTSCNVTFYPDVRQLVLGQLCSAKRGHCGGSLSDDS